MLKCLSLALLFVDECTRIELPAIVSGLLYELKFATNKVNKFVLQTLFRTVIPICFGKILERHFFNSKVFFKLFDCTGSTFDDDCVGKCRDDIPSIITVVLECVPDLSAHFQLIETLMLFKKNLWAVSTFLFYM